MGGLFNSLGNWVLEGNTHFWFWLCLLVYWRIKSAFCSLCHIPPCHSELLGKSTGFLDVDRSRVLPVGVTHWAGQSLGQLKGTLEKHQQQSMLFQTCPHALIRQCWLGKSRLENASWIPEQSKEHLFHRNYFEVHFCQRPSVLYKTRGHWWFIVWFSSKWLSV